MGSNFEPKMAERTSNSTFNLEACLRTIMEKLDHTIMVSETALKMAQEIQQKISEPESRAPTFDNHQGSNDSKSTEDPRGEGEEPLKTKERESKTTSREDSTVLANKVEALERTLKGIRRADDRVDVRTLSLFPKARIPLQFKMPELEKFDGTGCPKTHLKMYVRAMHPRGANDELLAQMFHESLVSSALKWFLALEESRTKTWEDVCNEFTNHYKYNTEVDVTRRDLETTKQAVNETFSSFITRWRIKASQMANRPKEEQIQMVVKNLLPIYHEHLFAHYFQNFKALIGAGTQVEDAIANGTIENEGQAYGEFP